MSDLISRQAAIDALHRYFDGMLETDTWSPCDVYGLIEILPSADVRKNVHAKKVIGGGERDGATCWFECSHCHGTVDIEDAYCKHCGTVLEIGERKDG